MRKSIMLKVGAVGTTFAMAGALAIAASGTTGAYFSDTKPGNMSGNSGSIKISTLGSTGTGVDNLNFTFDNLMPGEAQTATVNFTNTGKKAQDIYLTFPNRTALHALNNLGSFGEVTVANGGDTLFHSTNLNDGRRLSDTGDTCGGFSETGCWPLPTKLKVATNVAPDASGSVSFSFKYPTKQTGGQDVPFNVYPAAGESFGLDAVGSGNGLPVNVVAVQVGQQP